MHTLRSNTSLSNNTTAYEPENEELTFHLKLIIGLSIALPLLSVLVWTLYSIVHRKTSGRLENEKNAEEKIEEVGDGDTVVDSVDGEWEYH